MITSFTVGQKFPLNLPKSDTKEYAVVDLFNKDSFNQAIIGLDNPTIGDSLNIGNNKIQCGVIFLPPVILFIINIDGFAIFDCSLDMKLYKNPEIPEITLNDRLFLNLFAINTNDNVLWAMRGFTLAPETTSELVFAAMQQMKLHYTKEDFENALREFARMNPYQLMHLANMKEVGL